MKRIPKLTKEEKLIEDDLLLTKFINVKDNEFEEIAKAIKARQKNEVLNIRINGEDLAMLKSKAEKSGIKYQSFISEILHRVAKA